VSGVDLNANVRLMPYSHAINYQVANFMQTSFPNESFVAVTAISVIEHGFQSQSLLKEVTRLLRPNGYFIMSFDYWPEKIDTQNIKIFELDWRIFSQEEVLGLLKEASYFGLRPCGNVNLDACEAPITYCSRDYTFAWLVLQKGAE
jgi:ubiquinone/menaquinone biosynthesis C-methylase UbiE